MDTNNPILRESTFAQPAIGAEVMTINGTIQKTAGLLFLLVCSGAYTWTVTRVDGGVAAAPWAIGGAVIGFILVLAMCFARQFSHFLAPAYALAEGLFLGAISAMMESQFHGIVFNAAALTVGTLAAMLVIYRTGLIKPTQRFYAGVFAATAAIAIVYVVSIVLNMFGREIPMIHQSGAVGIGFSLFVVAIAALNLIIDFDVIESGAANGAPRYMEWYAGAALLITLVWLYLEILRLLSKLNNRR